MLTFVGTIKWFTVFNLKNNRIRGGTSDLHNKLQFNIQESRPFVDWLLCNYSGTFEWSACPLCPLDI